MFHSVADFAVEWTFEDLFTIQYPFAVFGIACWVSLFAVSQAYEMVYLKPFSTLIPDDITQLCLYGLSGPGFIFITKNLMKPLFCISTVVDDAAEGQIKWKLAYLYGLDKYGDPEPYCQYYNGTCQNTTSVTYNGDGVAQTVSAGGVTSIVGCDKASPCWSEQHLTYCTITLCCLCIYIPTAALTKSQFFLPEEDIRFVYYFQRLELSLKGFMIFVALRFGKSNELLALTFLVVSSCVLSTVVYVMQPSNMKFVNRIKYMIHVCSIWMCITCFWAILFDNTDKWLHVGVVFSGWMLILIAHVTLERTKFANGADLVPFINKEDVDDDVIHAAAVDILNLQASVTSPLTVYGKRISWGTHAHILRLLQYAKHQNAAIKRKSFETMAVLSYLDQMTKKSSFCAYTANTCMELYCDAIAQPKAQGDNFINLRESTLSDSPRDQDDPELRRSSVRILKTFLQRGRHVDVMADLLAGELNIAGPVAAMIKEGTQLSSQIDAGICLLEICSIDSNQLKEVLPLLPILNEWLITGSLVAQHLALELIARCSSRFDFAESIVASHTLPAMFELFFAIDEANFDSSNVDASSSSSESAQKKENASSGFRKGCVQPTSISNLAHQLPKKVLREFAAQFNNSNKLVAAMGDKTVSYAGEIEDGDEEEEEAPPSGITADDFVAWANAGSALAEQLKDEVRAGRIEGLAADEVKEGDKPKPLGFVSKRQLRRLFGLIAPDGQTLRDENPVADFFEKQGLGEQQTILLALLEAGLRPRGIEEMFATDESVQPERFSTWLRLSETNERSLAKSVVDQIFKAEQGQDGSFEEMANEIFSFIDEV